jgi:hypothetical protein
VPRVREFVLRRFDAPPPAVACSPGDRHGATRDEADALARPAVALQPARPVLGGTRAGLKPRRLAVEGVALGHRTGFDSGSTLDYVYRNRHAGGAAGPLIDRNYLESIGWRGIRQRKLHVEELLRLAMARLREAGRRCACSTSPPDMAATCSKP